MTAKQGMEVEEKEGQEQLKLPFQYTQRELRRNRLLYGSVPEKKLSRKVKGKNRSDKEG